MIALESFPESLPMMTTVKKLLACTTLFLLTACQEPSPSKQEPQVAQQSQQLANPSEDAELNACYRAKDQILRGVMNHVWQHQNGCQVDADCTLFTPSIPCQENCPVAIAAKKREMLTHALEAYARTVCDTSPKNCTVSGQCVPWTGVRCVAGACQAVVDSGPAAPLPPPPAPSPKQNEVDHGG